MSVDTPIEEVAGKVASCRAILDLGRSKDDVSGCEEIGRAEVRRCDEFIAPSLCASCATQVCKEADPCREYTELCRCKEAPTVSH